MKWIAIILLLLVLIAGCTEHKNYIIDSGTSSGGDITVDQCVYYADGSYICSINQTLNYGAGH